MPSPCHSHRPILLALSPHPRYKELEDAAHHGREPHLATLAASKKKTLAERGGVAFVGNAFAGKSSTVAPSPLS